MAKAPSNYTAKAAPLKGKILFSIGVPKRKRRHRRRRKWQTLSM